MLKSSRLKYQWTCGERQLGEDMTTPAKCFGASTMVPRPSQPSRYNKERVGTSKNSELFAALLTCVSSVVGNLQISHALG